MESPVMKKSEVAQYFNVDEKTIDNWTKDGVLTRLKVSSVRYNRHEIEKLAGVDLTPTSSLERRKLKREIEEKEHMILELKARVEKLENIIKQFAMLSATANLEMLQKSV